MLDECKQSKFFTYLKEARGHGSTWHAIIGWHVAHHWTGSSGCALKKNTRNHRKLLEFTFEGYRGRTICTKALLNANLAISEN